MIFNLTGRRGYSPYRGNVAKRQKGNGEAVTTTPMNFDLLCAVLAGVEARHYAKQPLISEGLEESVCAA